MPDPNVIVSTSIRIQPPLDRPPAELLRAEGGLSVELDEGRRVRLDPDDRRSEGFAEILDRLSKQRLPVYLEIDPETSAIALLRIPHVTHVAAVHPIEDGLVVELERSHGQHLLRRGAPDYDVLERQLRDALAGGELVVLTENDAHEIIDLRGYTPGPEGPPAPFPEVLEEPELPPQIPPPRWWIDKSLRLWHWRWWPWWWFRCLSAARAQQIFDAMSARSCDPLTTLDPCIPFLYPDDGCFARAHEMCRLMNDMGHTPKKVWIESHWPAYLHVDTKNHPDCYVDWGWHVAPTVCVRGPRFFQIQEVVIDPSLFTAPVSKPTWKSVQGDPNATLTDTDASFYFYIGSVSTDPNYVNTKADLAFYRLQLQARALQVGPPPYANCP
jgi:Glutaminase